MQINSTHRNLGFGCGACKALIKEHIKQGFNEQDAKLLAENSMNFIKTQLPPDSTHGKIASEALKKIRMALAKSGK